MCPNILAIPGDHFKSGSKHCHPLPIDTTTMQTNPISITLMATRSAIHSSWFWERSVARQWPFHQPWAVNRRICQNPIVKRLAPNNIRMILTHAVKRLWNNTRATINNAVKIHKVLRTPSA